MSEAPIGLLYDIHGNLVALESVLDEAQRAGAASYLLGGDYATFGPWPRETVELLETLSAVGRIRGNVERWLRDEPEVPASARPLVASAVAAARGSLGPSLVARLYDLPSERSWTASSSATAHRFPISTASLPSHNRMRSECAPVRRSGRSFSGTVISSSGERDRAARCS